ncbi:MAG TPA: heme biosynthesis HemY N-terminal domain-containing protein [Burkholderiaceae bacterium]
MRFFLWLSVLMAGAVGLAVTARFNPGNVVLFYPPYRVDLSLNFFLFLLGLLFLFLYYAVRAVRATQSMPGKVAEYRRQRREREAIKALREAQKALFEGRFGHAEKAALRAGDVPENAGVAALIGARAAHRMRQGARRDEWLAKSAQDNSLKVARLMTTIELAVDDHEAKAALAAVSELNATGTRHIHALQMALRAYQQAKDWSEVLRVVKLLDKRNALHPALSARLRELAYESLLSDKSHDAESLQRVWNAVEGDDRKKPFVAARAATAFNQRGLHDEARAIAERALASEWDERVVRVYVDSAAPAGSAALLAQIEACEAWLKQRPNDAMLELALGSLCLRQKLWGKAQRYLELALSDAVEAGLVRDAHLKLALMHEALQQDEEAARHYKQCALAATL